jgi:hypothetical protein
VQAARIDNSQAECEALMQYVGRNLIRAAHRGQPSAEKTGARRFVDGHSFERQEYLRIASTAWKLLKMTARSERDITGKAE